MRERAFDEIHAVLTPVHFFADDERGRAEDSERDGLVGTAAQIVLPNIQFQDAGKYRLLAVSDKGCSTNDSTTVVVNPIPATPTA